MDVLAARMPGLGGEHEFRLPFVDASEIQWLKDVFLGNTEVFSIYEERN